MIRVPDNSPCADCDHFKGVKQPNGDESIEYFYCEKFKKIPLEHLKGKSCKHQENENKQAE